MGQRPDAGTEEGSRTMSGKIAPGSCCQSLRVRRGQRLESVEGSSGMILELGFLVCRDDMLHADAVAYALVGIADADAVADALVSIVADAKKDAAG